MLIDCLVLLMFETSSLTLDSIKSLISLTFSIDLPLGSSTFQPFIVSRGHVPIQHNNCSFSHLDKSFLGWQVHFDILHHSTKMLYYRYHKKMKTPYYPQSYYLQQ